MTIGEFCKLLEANGATAISVGEKDGKGFVSFQYEGSVKSLKGATELLRGIVGKNVVCCSNGEDQYHMLWR